MRFLPIVCLLTALPLSLLVSAVAAQERRTIAVSVIDKQGKFVEDLTTENFRGKLSREPIKILSVELARGSRRIGIVIDSFSLDRIYVYSAGRGYNLDVWWLHWQVGLDVALALGASHTVALFAGENLSRVETGFLRDPDVLVQKILQAKARIKSQRDALRQSKGNQPAPELRGLILDPDDYRIRMERLGARRRAEAEASRGPQKLIHGLRDLIVDLAGDSSIAWEPGDVVYVVSLVQDFHSSASADDVKNALAQRGLRAFYVWLADDAGVFRRHNADVRKFGQELANATGGLWLQLRHGKLKPEAIEKRVKPLYEMIAHYYKLEVEFPSGIRKPQKWNLEVLDKRGKKMKGVKVAYPSLLVPGIEPATN